MKNAIRNFTCIGCGIVVSRSCTKTVKYCSAECYHKTGKTGRNKTGAIKSCVVCEKTFYVPKNRLEKSKTCSVYCSNKYQGRMKVTICCAICGKEKVLSPFFSNQKHCSIKCRNKSAEFKDRLLQMNANQQKVSINKIEKIGYSILDSIGVLYVPQHLLFKKFCVDAFVPSKNTVIQFDGDYWHFNKSKFSIADKRQKKRVSLDLSQDKYMKKAGVSVIRIWESDLINNKETVKDRLLWALT